MTGMAPVYVSQGERATSALAAFGLVLGIAYVLIFGLQAAWKPQASETLVSIGIEPRRPPPPSEQLKRAVKPAKASAPKGAPAPPNLKNKATPVVAPPKQLVILPPPIVVATQAGIGNSTSSGAADKPGPGQGAGGIGSGYGGGGEGGEGSGVATGPRQIRGRLKFSDVPESILGPGQTASVDVRYTVETSGRVSNCRIDRTSRIAALDALACRLIEQRFRFRPAHDEEGRPVRSVVVENHTWSVEPDDEPR